MGSAGAWSATDFGLTLAMWVVMMLAMMLPSIIPLTLVYDAVRRKALRQGSPTPQTLVFVAGYAATWAVFSVLATTAQLLLDRAGVLSADLASTSRGLAGGLLLVAGAYELTPQKRTCLRACRGPADFVSRHWRDGTSGALALGVHAGLFCLGCCWMLMALLFVGGVMNLLWVAAISAFVLVEKLMPLGELTSRVSGLALLAAGTALVVLAV